MNSLFSAIFLGINILAIQQTSAVLATGSQSLQSQLDSAILNQDCRSDFNQSRYLRTRINRPEPLLCLFRRIDYAAPGTREYWPASICAIIEEANSTHINDGSTLCNFQ